MKNIKVFSDFACPFCYIGFSIADRLRNEVEDIDIVYYPYILDSTVPLDGADLKESIPQDKIDMAYKRIQRLGKEYGLVYNNKSKKFNTNRLHKTALYAEDKGLFFEFSKEAFRYIFELGENVADPQVINMIAQSLGLDVNEMNEEIDSGKFDQEIEDAIKLSRAYNIESVPTFIINDEKHVTRLKDYERFIRDLLE